MEVYREIKRDGSWSTKSHGEESAHVSMSVTAFMCVCVTLCRVHFYMLFCMHINVTMLKKKSISPNKNSRSLK